MSNKDCDRQEDDKEFVENFEKFKNKKNNKHQKRKKFKNKKRYIEDEKDKKWN